MARKKTPPRVGRTLDQDGNTVGGLNAAAQPSDDWSFGASVYEFLNPGTVQREDAAIGAKPRTYTEVWGDAFSGMTSAAEETRQEIAATAQKLAFTLGPIIVIGLVAAAVLVVASKRR
jgi:hypothetical protein